MNCEHIFDGGCAHPSGTCDGFFCEKELAEQCHPLPHQGSGMSPLSVESMTELVAPLGEPHRSKVRDYIRKLENRLALAESALKQASVDAKDAARYRWLKQASKAEYLMARGVFALDDAAIDGAMVPAPAQCPHVPGAVCAGDECQSGCVRRPHHEQIK